MLIATKPMLDEIRGQKLNTGDAILSLLTFPVSIDLDEVLAHPPLIILDDVRNSENLGSVLRTAYCLGITSVISSETAWAALRDTRAARCSMGTIFNARLHRATGRLEQTIGAVKAAGITVYGAEIDETAKPATPHGPEANWAMVLGNEDRGVSTAVRTACDQLVMIPQASGDSFNVGHAAAMCMYELGKTNPRHHDGKAACT